jgi:hypothetical protein
VPRFGERPLQRATKPARSNAGALHEGAGLFRKPHSTPRGPRALRRQSPPALNNPTYYRADQARQRAQGAGHVPLSCRPSARIASRAGETEAAAHPVNLPVPFPRGSFGSSVAGSSTLPLRTFPIGTQSSVLKHRKGTTMTTQPAHKIRIGNLSAIIWRNTGENDPSYSVQPQRSYKNSDDEWRQTESMGVDDLLTMAKLLDMAHTWVVQQMEADRKARKQAEEA